MIGKILFTLAVILLVAVIWRTRRQGGAAPRPVPRLINPRPVRRWPVKALAMATVGLMLLTGGYVLYERWQERREVVVVTVVEAATGRTTDYRARRQHIGQREFLTLEGRRVVLAETERLEAASLGGAMPGRN